MEYLVMQSGQSDTQEWNLDSVLEGLAKRIERAADRVESFVTGTTLVPAIEPADGAKRDELPTISPLRHWRWE